MPAPIGDAAEDINMNGVVDEDETSAIDPDTDDNGLCDGARADSDGDGVANPVDPCVGQQVIYVDPAAPAGGDGTTWRTALNSPVDIVGAAAGQEAWVAAGTYRPGAANTIDVAFIGNRAGTGGGMDNTYAYPTMVNVAFVANADGGGGWGGGHSDAWFTEAVFDRVSFSRNLSHSGGGICTHDSGAVLNEVTFNQNGGASTLEGGGLSSGGSNLTLTSVTFTGNHADAAGGNGGAIHLVDSNADVSNISVVNNTSPVGGGIYASGNTVATVSNLAFWNNPGGDLSSSARVMTPANTCSQDAITGTTMAQLAADPFVMPNASGEVYLNTSASDLSCFDLGDDATATTLGIDWSNQTTQQDGALDADSGDGVSVGNDVDAGRHYDPMAVTIPSFATDASTISWTASNATQCSLTNDADWSLRPVAPGASPLPHTQTTGTELFLICFGNAGEPAVTWAVVP